MGGGERGTCCDKIWGCVESIINSYNSHRPHNFVLVPEKSACRHSRMNRMGPFVACHAILVSRERNLRKVTLFRTKQGELGIAAQRDTRIRIRSDLRRLLHCNGMVVSVPTTRGDCPLQLWLRESSVLRRCWRQLL